jgi:hypothetical protein
MKTLSVILIFLCIVTNLQATDNCEKWYASKEYGKCLPYTYKPFAKDLAKKNKRACYFDVHHDKLACAAVCCNKETKICKQNKNCKTLKLKGELEKVCESEYFVDEKAYADEICSECGKCIKKFKKANRPTDKVQNDNAWKDHNIEHLDENQHVYKPTWANTNVDKKDYNARLENQEKKPQNVKRLKLITMAEKKQLEECTVIEDPKMKQNCIDSFGNISKIDFYESDSYEQELGDAAYEQDISHVKPEFNNSNIVEKIHEHECKNMPDVIDSDLVSTDEETEDRHTINKTQTQNLSTTMTRDKGKIKEEEENDDKKSKVSDIAID